MTLLEKCQSLQGKRAHLVRLQNSANETSALQFHANQLANALQDFSRVVKIRCALISENIKVEDMEYQKVQEIANALARIRERFSKNPSRQALIADNDWPVLNKGLKALSPSINNSCARSWESYSDDLFTKTSIVEPQVVKTERNIARLREYREIQRQLRLLSKQWENIESVRAFKAKGSMLLELAKELNEFQAPEDVKKFLDALNVNGSASLDLLTDNVISWLKEQKIYTMYKIVGAA